MHAKIIAFAASAFFMLGNAVPLNNGKRDIVWVTEVETAIETVAVTSTVWVDPTPTNAPVDAAAAPQSHGHRHRHSSSSQAAVEVQPTPSPSSASPVQPEVVQSSSSSEAPPAYVAPTTSSTPAPVPEPTVQAVQSSSTPEPASTTSTTSQAAVVTPESTYEAPSSTYVAPVSSYVAPSSTYVAPAATSSAPASYSSGSSSSGSNPASGKSFTGDATYFSPGMGACGHDSTESEHMVAISHTLFDQYTPNGNPNANPLCGKSITIKGLDGADHEATIWDRCVGCAEADIDMPESFFNTVTKNGDGRVHDISWSIN